MHPKLEEFVFPQIPEYTGSQAPFTSENLLRLRHDYHLCRWRRNNIRHMTVPLPDSQVLDESLQTPDLTYLQLGLKIWMILFVTFEGISADTRRPFRTDQLSLIHDPLNMIVHMQQDLLSTQVWTASQLFWTQWQNLLLQIYSRAVSDHYEENHRPSQHQRSSMINLVKILKK